MIDRCLFYDGAFAGVDEIDLGRFRIDADDFMTFLGQASRRNGPDVSKAQTLSFMTASHSYALQSSIERGC